MQSMPKALLLLKTLGMKVEGQGGAGMWSRAWGGAASLRLAER